MTQHFSGHWDEIGQGPPVLCISGFASANWMFRPLVTPLANRHRFILPDNRGMGRSPPAREPYRLDDLAQDLLALMDGLGYQRFAVIGISMGGFVAQLLALAAPRRVTHLALLCTTSSGEAFRSIFPSLTRDQVKTIYQLDLEYRIRAALAPSICPLLATRYPETHATVIQERLNYQEDPIQVLLQYDAVAAFMETPLDLAAITCPALILSGDQDLLVPLANAHLLAQKLPNAQLTVIPETDHLFFLEQTDAVAGHIGDFLG